MVKRSVGEPKDLVAYPLHSMAKSELPPNLTVSAISLVHVVPAIARP
jgi:hypothetical protein